MKQDLTDFINSQDEGERPLLEKYYNLYLELMANGDEEKANGDEEKASTETLDFFKAVKENQNRDLYTEVIHAIEVLENEGHQGYTGGKRKKSRKSRNKRSNKKSRKSRRRRSRRN